jgi:predicted dehydrogenase
MRVLIIGLGSVGKKHINAIKLIYPDAEVFALRSQRDSENIPYVRNIFDIDEVSSVSFDFAIISNPTFEHKRSIDQLIQFGFPLFIEKPVYLSLDIEDLVAKVNEKKILTYVACNLRFLDCIKFIKEQTGLINNKKLNEVNVYCGSYLPDWRPNLDFSKIYSVDAKSGGGVHLDLIHELDYLYWIFGTPNEVKRNFRAQSSLSITSIDYANYLLDYSGFCANVVLNYYRRDSKRSLELIFDGETWIIDLLTNTITCNEKLLFSSKQQISDTYKEQMEYFTDCVSKNSTTFNTISDAFSVLKICLEK